MKIGCHAVLFGDRIATETDEILKGLSETGCLGVEMGARFFEVEKNVDVKKLFDKYGMQLSGLHVSALWTDLLDAPEKVDRAVGNAVEFLRIMPNKNIIFTGLNQNNPAQMSDVSLDVRLADPMAVKQMVEKLNEIAERTEAEGVTLRYHNHCWEFDCNGLLYQTIINHAPKIKFALDTGWAAGSGWDPVQLIEKYPDRISYVHLRDFKKEIMDKCGTFAEKQSGYTELGAGDMDYIRLLSALNRHISGDCWAIVEYEKGEKDFERYTKAIAYVRNLIEQVNVW